jgi:hypothetical protein
MTLMYILCRYVGPVHLVDFSRTMQSLRLEAGPATTIGLTTSTGGPPAVEAERVPRWVEQNLTTLTHVIPMEEIEDLQPVMKNHIVGVPRTRVQLFRHLANVVVHYGRANRPRL